MELGMYQVNQDNMFVPAVRSGDTVHIEDGPTRQKAGLALEQDADSSFRPLGQFEGGIDLSRFAEIARRENVTGIVNCTPHRLNLLAEDGEEMAEIRPSGYEVRVRTTRRQTGEVNGIPVFDTDTQKVAGLPPARDGLVFVVSGFACSEADRDDVYSPGKLVRDSEGNPVGAEGLSR